MPRLAGVAYFLKFKGAANVNQVIGKGCIALCMYARCLCF
jgi:hypothetical protein